MDVVLLKDVERLGTEGTVVHVKPGYARNYLVPSGLAAPATPSHLKAVEARKRQRIQQSQRVREEAEALKHKLEGQSFILKLNLGEDNTPFGSITAHDLVAALAQGGLVVDKHAIQLDQPIKALGAFEVPVRVHAEVTATLKVSVVKA